MNPGILEYLQWRRYLRYFLVAHRASKNTVVILSRLQAAYPYPQTPEHEGLHQLLGSVNERITSEATQLLRSGNAPLLGTDQDTALVSSFCT